MSWQEAVLDIAEQMHALAGDLNNNDRAGQCVIGWETALRAIVTAASLDVADVAHDVADVAHGLAEFERRYPESRIGVSKVSPAEETPNFRSSTS